MLDDINEQDTSFLEYKHKHMMKSGAPLDNFGALCRLLPIEFHSTYVNYLQKPVISL